MPAIVMAALSNDLKLAIEAQQPQRSPTRNVAVERDLARHAWKGRRERFSKEGLCCRNATVTATQEVDRLAVLVDAAL
jgi:hypothetical protein